MFEEQRQFNYFAYQKMDQGFCHHRPLAVHLQIANHQSAFSIAQLIEVKNGKCGVTDMINLNHSFADYGQLAITTRLSSLNLNYSYVLPKVVNQTGSSGQTVVHTSLNSDRKLQNAQFQLGVDRKTSSMLWKAGISALLYEHKNQYFLYGKLLYLSNKFNVGLLSILDCRSKNLQTNNVVVELKPSANHQIFLRGEVEGLRNYSLRYTKLSNYFDFFIADYVYRPTRTLTMMAEIKYDLNSRAIKSIDSLIEKQFPQKKLKMKINNLGDVAVLVQTPLDWGKQSSFSFGLQVADILKNRKISYGFSISANY